MITRAEIDLSHRYEEYWPAFLAVLNAARCFISIVTEHNRLITNRSL